MWEFFPSESYKHFEVPWIYLAEAFVIPKATKWTILSLLYFSDEPKDKENIEMCCAEAPNLRDWVKERRLDSKESYFALATTDGFL